MKSTHRRRDITRPGRISHCEAVSHPPEGRISLKKARFRVLFSLSKNYLLMRSLPLMREVAKIFDFCRRERNCSRVFLFPIKTEQFILSPGHG